MYKAATKKPVMKVKHLHKIPESKKVWPVMLDEKIDGVYCYCIMKPGDYRIFSMTGKQYLSMGHLSDEAHRLAGIACGIGEANTVMIFEAHIIDQPINVISGACRSHDPHTELYGVVHDLLPYDDFIAGYFNYPYAKRREMAQYYVGESSELFITKDWWWCRDETLANVYFDEITARGGEGIIGRNPKGFWKANHTKNADCWKKKIKLSFDLLVEGIERGKDTGKYADTLGTLLCRFRKFGEPDGELCTVKCDGMTDAQRGAWYEDPTRIINSIVKVDAMTYTKNGLLREPKFQERRLDKNEADF